MHGALAVLGLGIVLLIAAALRDRQTRRRAERAALQQTAPLPGLPDDAPAPRYVPASEVERISRPTPLTPDMRRTIEQWCTDATPLELRLASDELATHLDPPTAVLHSALVLVCSDGIGSLREVLPTAEQSVRTHQALVLATTECAPDVVDTLRVNLRAGRLRSCVLLGSADALAACCAATGAAEVPRTMLQSGATLDDHLGRARRLVAMGDRSWVGEDAD